MITYTDPVTNKVASCSLASSVPEGVEYFEVTPPETKEFRGAWIINAGNIDIDLDKAKAIKVKQAKAASAEMMKVITDEYDAHEIATWDIQEAEARGDKPDDYLVGLALSSGTPLADLKAKIIANATAYRTASANAVGKRQAMEKACMVATTVEELIGVTF